MIFTRIRVGKLLNLEPWGKKNPCVTTSSHPTTSIKNCWWWLRQLLFGEWVWQDCQSFLTCTLHPRLTSQRQNKPPPSPPQDTTLSMTVKNTHALPIHVLSVGCSPSRRRGILAHSRVQEFPGFNHVVFLCRFADGVAISFPHRLICGVCIVVAHAQIGRLQFLPSAVYVSLSPTTSTV